MSPSRATISFACVVYEHGQQMAIKYNKNVVVIAHVDLCENNIFHFKK